MVSARQSQCITETARNLIKKSIKMAGMVCVADSLETRLNWIPADTMTILLVTNQLTREDGAYFGRGR